MKPYLILVSGKSEHITKVCEFLRCAEINILFAENVHEARAGLIMRSPAFVLLDFDVKGSDLFLSEMVCSNLSSLPYIIVASFFSNSGERVSMLKQGADACAEKPINPEEVLAIIRTVQRRERRSSQNRSTNHSPYVIEHEEMTIIPSSRSVTMRGIPIALTRKEYDVLYFLAKHAGNVMTKQEIYTAVWKDKYNPKTTHVSDQISSLRYKLGLNSRDRNYIQTVIGIGYRFGTAM